MLWDAQARSPAAGQHGVSSAVPVPLDPPSPADAAGPSAIAALTRFVHDHAVAFESLPRHEWRDGRRVAVGYDVTVFARHPLGLADDPSSPRNDAFRRGFDALLGAIVPPARDGLSCRQAEEPLRLVLRRENDWVPEVEARVEVRHAEATFDPTDDAQKACLREVEARLRRLGAQSPIHDDGRPSVRGSLR